MSEALPPTPFVSASDNYHHHHQNDPASHYNISKSLIDALFNTRDRQFVIKLEESLLDFIESNTYVYTFRLARKLSGPIRRAHK